MKRTQAFFQTGILRAQQIGVANTFCIQEAFNISSNCSLSRLAVEG